MQSRLNFRYYVTNVVWPRACLALLSSSRDGTNLLDETTPASKLASAAASGAVADRRRFWVVFAAGIR